MQFVAMFVVSPLLVISGLSLMASGAEGKETMFFRQPNSRVMCVFNTTVGFLMIMLASALSGYWLAHQVTHQTSMTSAEDTSWWEAVGAIWTMVWIITWMACPFKLWSIITTNHNYIFDAKRREHNAA